MKKILSAVLASAMLLSCGAWTGISASAESNSKQSEMRDITTMELVRDMGYGINLGNTFEACGDWINGKTPNDFQKAWGSPVITEKTIKTYSDAGFGVLRIPVAWSNMISKDGKYTIAPEYIARVKEVVDWTLDSGMYAIINIHWDNGWVNDFPKNEKESMKRYKAMWKQIAAAFKDYPDKLMFESQNEELGWESIWNPWGGTQEQKKKSYDLANRINQAFVDVVRAGGGNNPKRHLLISGYNTGIDRTCDKLFEMPKDPANRMAVSVHYYEPSTLCILDKDASWGKAITTWGSEKDLAVMNRSMNMLKTTFIDKGIPVIVGEYGCFGNNKKREVKEKWMLTVSKAMWDIGACPVLWDTPGDECDRAGCKFRDPDFIKQLIKPAKSANNSKNNSDTKTSSNSASKKPAVKATTTKNSVKLTWKAVGGAEKYRVYKVVNGKTKLLKETKKCEVLFSKLKADTKYQYIVSAYVNGKWTTRTKSDIVTVKTKKA